MHILGQIRMEGEIARKAKKLCSDYKYDPTAIGCAILQACGHDVTKHLKGDISVKDKAGKLLYFSDYPDYEM